jgi:hypothetical protein
MSQVSFYIPWAIPSFFRMNFHPEASQSANLPNVLACVFSSFSCVHRPQCTHHAMCGCACAFLTRSATQPSVSPIAHGYVHPRAAPCAAMCGRTSPISADCIQCSCGARADHPQPNVLPQIRCALPTAYTCPHNMQAGRQPNPQSGVCAWHMGACIPALRYALP